MGKQVRQARVPKAAPKVQEQAEGEEAAVMLSFLPVDPEDPRLQPEGAVCSDNGKINVEAYEDLKKSYAGEPPPEQHPNPATPGVRQGEFVPKGLRIWDDVAAGCSGKDGAGWIAMYSSKINGKPEKTEKWFNIRTCGSWRLAFLLARLQRGLWERRGAAALAAAKQARPAQAAGGADAEAAAGAGPTPAEPSTPKGKRRAAPAAGEETARKQQRRQPQAPRQQPPAATKPPPAAAPPAGPSKLDAFRERMLAKFKKDSGEQAKESGEQAKESGEPAKESGEQAKESGEQAKESGEQAKECGAQASS